jgi:hypothetical protein
MFKVHSCVDAISVDLVSLLLVIVSLLSAEW